MHLMCLLYTTAKYECPKSAKCNVKLVDDKPERQICAKIFIFKIVQDFENFL